MNISEVLFLLKNKLFSKYLDLDFNKKVDSLKEKEVRRNSIRSSLAGNKSEKVKKSLLDIVIDDKVDMNLENLGILNHHAPLFKTNTLYIF